MLSKDGVAAEIVYTSTREAFEQVAAKEEFDIVLADYLLPGYSGLDALKFFRERCAETPFLLVSGTIGEQAAIESLKNGATDYVLKLWPDRLVPSILRAIQEATERRQRRHAQTELLRREKYFRALTENTLDILTILNSEGLYLYNSPSLKRVLGYDPQELAGKRAFSMIHPDDVKVAEAAFIEAVQCPERTVRVDFRFLHKDGSWRYLEAVGQSHLADLEIGGVVVNSRDVSDRKSAEKGVRDLEDQLRQAQKMEAIGQLAGGVAHDFNNILTVIHGHASLLLQNASLTGAPARSARQIAEAAERAASLTRQLLTFSRRQVMQPRQINLNDLVSNMTSMLGRILGEDVRLRVNCSQQPPLVQADASMLEQVLLNLAVNARDAMPQGGSLTLAISMRSARELKPRCDTDAEHFACLCVTDSGCGIAPQDLKHVFEPFFTTKEVGKGTGLGLATVYGIVKQHNGWLEVESTVSQGSTFKVFLPAIRIEPVSEAVSDLQIGSRGGRETILVVEDEAPVRELVCDILSTYGYQVIQAESGVKALEKWKESGDKVDLMLTDLVMPDRLNGRQLAEKLWADRPGLKVIFTSGYSAEVVGKEFVLQPGIHYLQKPYVPDLLARKIRECLDARSN